MIIRVLFILFIAFMALWVVLGLAAYTNYFGKHRLKQYVKNLGITTAALVGSFVVLGVIASFDKIF